MTTGGYNASVNIDISKALQSLRRLQQSTAQTFQAIRSQSAIDLSERQQGAITSAAAGKKAITRSAIGQVAPIARAQSSQYLADTGYTGLIAEANVRNKVFGSMVRGQELSSFGGSGAEILGEVKAQQLLERIAIGVEANKILSQPDNVEVQAEFKLNQSIRDLDVSIELLTQQLQNQIALDKQGMQVGLRRQRNLLAQSRSYEAVPLTEQLGAGLQTSQMRRSRRDDINILERVAASFEKGQSPIRPYTDTKTGRLRFQGSPGYSARGITATNFRERFTQLQEQEGAFIQREEHFDNRLGTSKVMYRDILSGQMTKVTALQKQKLDELAGVLPDVTGKMGKLGEASTATAGDKGSKRGMAFLEDMSDKNVERFRQVSSAMQGMMLGMSILNGDIMGLAFSLIFLQFAGFGKLALGAAGATLVVGGLTKIIKNMNKEAKEARQLTRLFAEFNANPFAQTQATETAEQLIEQLGITEEIDEFVKALVRFQFEANRSGRALTKSDLITFIGIFAQAFGKSGSFEESIEAALSAMETLDTDGTASIDGVELSLERIMELVPRFITAFTNLNGLSLDELLNALRTFVQAGGELSPGLQAILSDFFTFHTGETDFNEVLNNFENHFSQALLDRPVGELSGELERWVQRALEGSEGAGIAAVLTNALVPDIQLAIGAILALTPDSHEEYSAWKEAWNVPSKDITSGKEEIINVLDDTDAIITKIAEFLGVTVPTEEDRLEFLKKYNLLGWATELGLASVEGALTYSNPSSAAGKLLTAKDKFFDKFTEPETLTKDVTVNVRFKYNYIGLPTGSHGPDSHKYGPREAVDGMPDDIWINLRNNADSSLYE